MNIKTQSRLGFLKDFKKNFELTLLALPAIIFIFAYCYIPLYGLVLPFKDYNFNQGFWGSPWAGLQNFEFLFSSNQLFIITRNTLGYNLLFIVTGVIVSVTLAIILNEVRRSSIKLYQTAMFFPYFMSWVVISYIVMAFLDMDNGLLNSILIALGKEPVMWYSNPNYWSVILVIANLWKNAGVNTIIYYAALISIDTEYYESAKLDGASRFKQAIHISVPMLKPLIIILSVLAIGKIFYSDFGLFYNLPQNLSILYPATDVIDTYVFRAVKDLGNFSMASAANFYQSICGFVLVLTANFIVRKLDNENRIF